MGTAEAPSGCSRIRLDSGVAVVTVIVSSTCPPAVCSETAFSGSSLMKTSGLVVNLARVNFID